MRRHLLASAIVALTIATTVAGLPAAPAKQARVASAWDGVLQAEYDSYPNTALTLQLDIASGRGITGRITILVPRGAEIYPKRPPGSVVGDASLVATDASFGTSTQSTLDGQIVSGSLPTTPTCTTEPPTAVWLLQLSLLGQLYTIPVYLSPATASDPPDAAYKLELCAPLLPQTSNSTPLPLPITSLWLQIGDLGPPSANGLHAWHALITPFAADRRTLLPAATYELRAITPIPNRLTLHGRYNPRTHVVVLNGRLTQGPVPRTHVSIEITALVRRVTSTGVQYLDYPVGYHSTTATGGYSLRTRIRRTTGFIASAETTTGSCPPPSPAPAGCLTSTYPGAQSDPITISVARR